jgi:hypothetical protein
MSQVLTKASNQWWKRPADERYTSLTEMHNHFSAVRERSKALVVGTKTIDFVPLDNEKALAVHTPAGEADATHHAFNQICTLGKVPAGYMRTIPAPLVADNLNYGLKFNRAADELGMLLSTDEAGRADLRAATGPNYGRIWNQEVVAALIERFGNGVDGHWRVPGEFGVKVKEVTKANTTLYASDRDMFVFLADEERRIEVPNRRGGQAGSLARGFFMWNGECGDTTFGLGTFLFDYACMNRTVWGAEQYAEVTIRHTAGAPGRFLDEMSPALKALSTASQTPVLEAIKQAQAKKLEDDLDAFLAKRFTRTQAQAMKAVHETEEGRPIETIWDATVAATAYARGLENQDNRVKIEREAGKMLKLAA